jgi:hypothetical protein
LKAEIEKRSCDPRDIDIAKRVRALQVQKYERGTNRISAGRLYRIAGVLEVPVSFFYEGLEGFGSELGVQPIGVEFGLLQTSGAMRLVRAYSRIEQGGVRQKLLLLAESLAGE